MTSPPHYIGFAGRGRITTTLHSSPQTIKPIPGDGFTASLLFMRQYFSNIMNEKNKNINTLRDRKGKRIRMTVLRVLRAAEFPQDSFATHNNNRNVFFFFVPAALWISDYRKIQKLLKRKTFHKPRDFV